MATATASGVTATSGTSNLASSRFTKKAMSSYNPQEWVVFEKEPNGEVKSPRLYPSTASRDNVRNAYTKHTGADFVSTRAVRVQTFKNRLKKSNSN